MILAPNNILRKGKLLAALTLLTASNLFAQEFNVPVATQYLADNPFVLSPTYAGIGDNIRIRVNGFSQWVGIKDAPQNQAIYADFRVFEQSGLGISLYNDKNGYTRQTGGKLTFAHHIILDYPSRQYLSFGLSYNLNNFRIETDKIKTFDSKILNDRYTANDNFDVGLLYRNKEFWVNFNASNLLNKDIKNYFKEEPNLLRFYQVYTGYTYKSYRDSKLEIEPSAYFQHFESDGRSFLDLNAKFRYLDNQRTGYFWLGATYRMLIDQPFKPLTVGPMVGLKKGGFYAGYAYQITTNELSSYNSGTHMITLGWDFFQGLSNCPCTQSSLAVD
ncbi:MULTISPECIES: PorP/SprF family type IX secretion system membrane protein [Flavobacterium]|uniref:Type IX secretion system membrane protein PorP/SprF n=1 Tax=Flavobacterium hankyongi TaxID=1176532 RepID=A0ABP8ZNZ3_9FLAO|nr:type IX secretion system membrane protein PorP/SprF [Flavobacterium sp. N1846]